MKKIFIFLIICLFILNLSSFVIAVHSQGQFNDKIIVNANSEMSKIKNITKNKIQNQERIRAFNSENCPEKCECSGSVIKCWLNNNNSTTREIKIQAGNSNNTIIQVKGEKVKTQVKLFKEGDKIYGKFKNNKTKEIKIMPNQIKEKIQKRLKLKNCSCAMELDNQGNYNVQTQKRVRLFGLISLEKKVKIKLDSETGEIIQIKNPWWDFFAKDINESIDDEN